MAKMNDAGQMPYSRVKLDNTASAAGDSPLALCFIGDETTGLGRPAQGAFSLIANGVEVARASGSIFTISAMIAESLSTALSANTGSAAGASTLTSANNFVSATGSFGGVKLPQIASLALAAGTTASICVFNDTASTIRVYAATGDTIDSLPADPGVPLSTLKRCMYITKTSTAWVSAQLGAISA